MELINNLSSVKMNESPHDYNTIPNHFSTNPDEKVVDHILQLRTVQSEKEKNTFNNLKVDLK